MKNKKVGRLVFLIVDSVIQLFFLMVVIILGVFVFSGTRDEANLESDIGFVMMFSLPLILYSIVTLLIVNIISQVVNSIWQFWDKSRITHFLRIIFLILNTIIFSYFIYVYYTINNLFNNYLLDAADENISTEVDGFFSSSLITNSLYLFITGIISIILYFILTNLEIFRIFLQLKKKPVITKNLIQQ